MPNTTTPVDVLTFLFKTEELEKLIHPTDGSTPEFILIKSTLQGELVGNKPEAILKVYAKGYNRAPGLPKADPTEVPGCPVPPCVGP